MNLRKSKNIFVKILLWGLDKTRSLRQRLGLRQCQIAPIVRLLKAWIEYHLGPSINARDQLPVLLKILNLNGKGVEVGVWQGKFSEQILSESALTELYSIDPWREFGRNEYVDISNVAQQAQDKNYQITQERLSPFKERSKVLRKTSAEAVKLFADNELDFVYIDAQHSYVECKNDIEMWWPKVKNHGILAGHDYLNGIFPEGHFGVKQAVDKFVQENNLKLHVTQENWPTWYVRRR